MSLGRRPWVRSAAWIALATLAFISTPGTTRGQESGPQAVPAPGREVFGRIRGTVYGTGKKPLAGQMVLLSSRDQNGLLRVTGTDDQGQYLFQDLVAGSYDIETSADGYTRQSKGRVEVRPPFQNLIDFQLVPAGSGAAAGGGPPADGAGAAPVAISGAKIFPAALGTGGGSQAPGAAMPGAEAGVQVRGLLRDQQRRPVGEVSVAFMSLEGKGIYQTFSGEKGDFGFQSLPSGRYRVRVASPGHVTLDLKSVEVAPPSGLNLSLTLVDYPLNSKGRPDRLLPREMPQRDAIQAPAPATAPPASAPGSPGPAATPAP